MSHKPSRSRTLKEGTRASLPRKRPRQKEKSDRSDAESDEEGSVNAWKMMDWFEECAQALQEHGLAFGQIVLDSGWPAIIFNPRYLLQYNKSATGHMVDLIVEKVLDDSDEDADDQPSITKNSSLSSLSDSSNPTSSRSSKSFKLVLINYLGGKEQCALRPLTSLEAFPAHPRSGSISGGFEQGKCCLQSAACQEQVYHLAQEMRDRHPEARVLSSGWIPALGIHSSNLEDLGQMSSNYNQDFLKASGCTSKAPSASFDKDILDEVNLIRCELCNDKADEANMLLCDKCNRGFHIYCLPSGRLGLAQDFDFDTDDFFCFLCQEPDAEPNSSDQVSSVSGESCAEEIVLVRPKDASDSSPNPESSSLEYFCMPAREWTCSPTSKALLNYCSSSHFYQLVTQRDRGGLRMCWSTSKVQGRHELASKTFVKTRSAFLNGTPFGVEQYPDAFSLSELEGFESRLMQVLNPDYISSLKPHTVDRSIRHGVELRTKLFLNFRYSYGRTGNKSGPVKSRLFNDVDDMFAVLPFTKEVLERFENLGIVQPGFINQAVVNYYNTPNSSLGVHQDDKDLFHRPIISLRLFSPCVLSFGCSGLGMKETSHFVPIKLPRGVVTSMDGIAANNFNHCVRQQDVEAFTVSIIFRRVKLARLESLS